MLSRIKLSLTIVTTVSAACLQLLAAPAAGRVGPAAITGCEVEQRIIENSSKVEISVPTEVEVSSPFGLEPISSEWIGPLEGDCGALWMHTEVVLRPLTATRKDRAPGYRAPEYDKMIGSTRTESRTTLTGGSYGEPLSVVVYVDVSRSHAPDLSQIQFESIPIDSRFRGTSAPLSMLRIRASGPIKSVILVPHYVSHGGKNRLFLFGCAEFCTSKMLRFVVNHEVPAGAVPTSQALPTAPAPGVNTVPSTAVKEGGKLALVVGNANYIGQPRLANPANDTRAVAAAFRKLGFAEVTEKTDLDKTALEAALKDFGDKAADADWAVVYYSGHGIQVDGQSYIVPTNARLARASHVEDEAIPLDRVLSKVRDAKKLRLVILDACRDNPFTPRMVQSAGTRNIGRGLGRIEPSGVLVAYSAKDGQLAQDGAGQNSPFTEALLEHLEEPGLEIGLLFRKVRDSVLRNTKNAQEPFVYGSIPSEEMYFRPKAK